MRSITVLLLICSFSYGQNAVVKFHSGTTVFGKIKIDEIKLKTKYGLLTVPIADVRTIEVGLQYDEKLTSRIESLIPKLGNNSFQTRDSAQKELLSLGKYSYPYLNKNYPNLNDEAQFRLLGIRETLKSKNLDKFVVQDSLTTYESVFRGSLQLPVFEIQTQDFDKITVNLSTVKSIVVFGSIATSYIVIANGEWIDTGLFLVGKYSITSSGSVDLWPQGAGQYVAGPKGYNTTGKGGKFLAGALIGRFGQSGEPFYIGESYTFESEPKGSLQLQIVDSPWNNSSSGFYKLTIKGN